jgi:hypothetical protein
MYIPPFLAGVLATLFVELAAIFLLAICRIDK